jgi:hypothetical protein
MVDQWRERMEEIVDMEIDQGRGRLAMRKTAE